MAKRIKLNVSKGVLIKADLPDDNPLSMIASAAVRSIHGSGRGLTAFSIHGRYASPVTASVETFHGASPVAPAAESSSDLNLFTFHGAVVLPIPEGQKVSSLEIRRGEDGELTIIVNE